MNLTTLASGHQPSDVVVIATALTAVIASTARPLFKWLELRAFMRMWQEVARRDSDMGWLVHFSHAMAAFRSRGKATSGGAPIEHGTAGLPVQSENPATGQDEPLSLVDLSLYAAQPRNGKGCLRVISRGDYVLISDSKHPDGPVFTCSSGEWNLFVEGIKNGDFDELQG